VKHSSADGSTTAILHKQNDRIMKTQTLSVLLGVILAATLGRGAEPTELSEVEKATLIKGGQALLKAYEAGDIDAIMSGTHESIMKLIGSREKYEAAIREAVQVLAAQVVVEEIEFGEPTPCYTSGTNEVTFIPKIAIMRMVDMRARDVGFLIAARTKGTKEWKYLDGAGVRKHPPLLWMLFPDLPKDIETPPNKIERLPPRPGTT
jgi:hypothetical protein